MKYYKTLGIYKASNLTFDPCKVQAFSYTWWKFVAVINDKIIFNNYRYSASTKRHQSKVLILMDELGIKADHFICCPKGLDDLSSGLEYYKNKIEDLKREIKKPGTSSKKNIKRKIMINDYLDNIILINDLIAG